MRATTTSAFRTRAWFRLGAAGAVLGLAIGAMTVIPAQVAGASTGNTYYVNSATDTPFTTLADLSGPALDCTSPTNTGCGIDDAIEFFNSDTTANNADTIVFSPSVSTFTVGQSTAINNTTSGVTLAINGNGANQTAVSGNHSVGVFEVDSSVVDISGLTIENGNAAAGGGIANFGGTLTVTDSTVSGNTTDTTGGGIFNFGGTVNLTDSTVSGNTTSGGSGGGIFNVNNTTVNLTDSTVSGNTSGASGGGIVNVNNTTVNLTDSTVSGNTAGGGNGGGILNENNDTTVNLTDSTVSGNTARGFGGPGAGGGIDNNGGTVSVGASIVAGNTGGVAPNCTGTPPTSDGYNLTNDTAGTQCGFIQSTDIVNTDPLLGALGGNGGPTQTMLPAPTSPAVGVIPPGTTLNSVPVCPRTDQRGVPSTKGANCTIGAVEVQVCATGLNAHVLTATYGTSSFTGLFCVNTKGVGRYYQGTVQGKGSITVSKQSIKVDADGKNVDLFGKQNKKSNSFVETAPIHVKKGTFTLS